MTLVTNSGMKVMSEAGLARQLRLEGIKSTDLVMTTRENKPTAVVVPYEIWFQIQHFISRVIER